MLSVNIRQDSFGHYSYSIWDMTYGKVRCLLMSVHSYYTRKQCQEMANADENILENSVKTLTSKELQVMLDCG